MDNVITLAELQTAGRGSYVIQVKNPKTKATRKFVRFAVNYSDAYQKMCEINCTYRGKRKFRRYDNWIGVIVSFTPETEYDPNIPQPE